MATQIRTTITASRLILFCAATLLSACYTALKPNLNKDGSADDATVLADVRRADLVVQTPDGMAGAGGATGLDGVNRQDGMAGAGGATGLDGVNRQDGLAGAGGSAPGGNTIVDGASSASGGMTADGAITTGGVGGASGGSMVDAPVTIDAPAPTPDAPVPLPVGSECSANSNCAGNNCVDGICCDTACTGCSACKQTFTGKPNGTCAAVVTGQDPHSACADETNTNQCGNDGWCDGAGACRKASTSQVCKMASCSGNTFIPSATCDGSGACKTVIPENCDPFQCEVTGCLKTCTSSADCGATNYCNIATGKCAAKLDNGKVASQPDQCTSGVVADGVCCNGACTGCRACSGGTLTGGAAGQCLPVLAGQVAHNACTASGVTCGLDGMCDGSGACRLSPPAGASCDDANLCITGRTCQAGQCKGGTTKTCTTPPACYSGTGTCSPSTGNCTYTKVADGPSSTCNDSNPCTTDTCNDGVCTSTAMVCSAAPACHSNPGTCSGGTCSYPVTNGASCGTGASCAGGMLTPGQVCSNTGSCGSGGSAQPCGNGYLCNGAGTGCSSTCSPNGCAAGYYCSGTSCVQKKGPGEGCGGNSECGTGYCVDGFCCENACSLSSQCMACSNALTGLGNGYCRRRNGSQTTPCPTTNPTACVDVMSDPNNCNSCGQICPSAGFSGGAPRCIAGTCGAGCSSSGQQVCINGSTKSCMATVFDFEDGLASTPYIYVDDASSGGAVQNEQSHTGTWAIRVACMDNPDSQSVVFNMFDYCGEGSAAMDLRLTTVSAWVWVPDISPAGATTCFLASTNVTFDAPASKTPPPKNQWFQLVGKFPTSANLVDSFRVECDGNMPDFDHPWYVDDVTIE